jgi:hypothetical protein
MHVFRSISQFIFGISFEVSMSKRKRIYHPLNTPMEIQQAIASNDPHSLRPEEWLAILNAVKAKYALSKKRAVNKKRHRHRNPNWPSSIRAAAWFAANRREVIDEPRRVASPQALPADFPAELESAAQPAVNGYELQWARQEAAMQSAEIPEQITVPQPPKPSEPVPPKKGEPGYATWLLNEIAKRKAAGTWVE